MDCPCEKCPVAVMCRQKVFEIMEKGHPDINLKTSITKFCFDRCEDGPRYYGETVTFCKILSDFLEMIDSNPDTGARQINTDKIKATAKALYFDADEIFST